MQKTVEALVFEDLGTTLTENIASEKPTAGSSKSPKLQVENLVAIKTSLRKEILSDLNKFLAENQKEKLITPTLKKSSNRLDLTDFDFENETTPFFNPNKI